LPKMDADSTGRKDVREEGSGKGTKHTICGETMTSASARVNTTEHERERALVCDCMERRGIVEVEIEPK
jgi:hypothetical protein